MKGGYVEGEIAVLSSLGRGLHRLCLLPTELSGICGLTVIFLYHPPNGGPGLVRDGGVSGMEILPDMPPSRASPLLQV